MSLLGEGLAGHPCYNEQYTCAQFPLPYSPCVPIACDVKEQVNKLKRRPPEQAVEPADRCPQEDHIRLIPGMGFLPTTSSASQGEPKEDRHETIKRLGPGCSWN